MSPGVASHQVAPLEGVTSSCSVESSPGVQSPEVEAEGCSVICRDSMSTHIDGMCRIRPEVEAEDIVVYVSGEQYVCVCGRVSNKTQCLHF